jgi:dipeptidyl aminopeptidase/acylaminoacyl peptidase
MRNKIKLLSFLLFISYGVFAQNTTLTPENLWNFNYISTTVVSPDGAKILYSTRKTDWKTEQSVTKVFIYDIKTKTTNMVNMPDTRFGGLFWHPKTGNITYTTAVNGKNQVFEINMDGSGKKQLTNLSEGVSSYKISPDGKRIAYSQTVQVDKKTIDIYPDLDKTSGVVYDELNFRHWDTWADGTYNHLFVAELATMPTQGKDLLENQPYHCPTQPFGGEDDFEWTLDGKSLLYVCKKERGTSYAYSTNTDIYKYDVETNKETKLTSDNKGYDNHPSISPDGRYLAYLSMQTPGYEADKNRLMIYDLTTNTKVEATANYDITVEGFTWGRNGSIFMSVPDSGTYQIYRYNMIPKKGQSTISKLTEGYHDYRGVYVGLDKKNNETLIGKKMSMTHPYEIYEITFDKKGKATETNISNVNTDLLKTYKFGKIERRLVKAPSDGKNVLTWVVYPPDFDANKKYPTVLYCQGGPQSQVSNFFSLRWNFQLMAAQGYIVVAPNRRGLPGFGKKWNDDIIENYGGAPMTDLLGAIDNVAQEKFVDKTRLGAVGASFGGYTVYWLAGNHNNRFKSFISHCGMYNMESWYGSTEEMFFAKNDQKAPYWENSTPFDKFSPHHFAKNWNTPILVIHNEKDFRVPLTQGLEAFNVAQSKNIKSRFLYFPNENHWVLRPQNSILWQREFYKWLDETLKK